MPLAHGGLSILVTFFERNTRGDEADVMLTPFAAMTLRSLELHNLPAGPVL